MRNRYVSLKWGQEHGLETSRNLFNWPFETYYNYTGNYDAEGELSKQACSGIADQTSLVINTNLSKLNFIKKADSISRNLPLIRDYLKVTHVATEILLHHKPSVVFDWHNTLSIGNPLIYYTRYDFLTDSNNKIAFKKMM